MLQKTLAPLTRLFFKLLYHQFAWTYDLVAAFVSFGRWQDWVRTLVPELNGPIILELGHGSGHLQKTLSSNKGLQVYGLDRSRQMGQLAKRRLINSGVFPKLVNANAMHLPFPPDSFNQVVATFPTEYIVSPNTISEVKRVLQRKGELFILPSARLTGNSCLHRFIDWLYLITGQSGEQIEQLSVHGKKQFNQAGFSLQVDTHQLDGSEVHVLKLQLK